MPSSRWPIFCFGLIVLFCSWNQTDDSRLKAMLRSRAAAHGLDVRPVLHPDDSTRVRFGLRLIRIGIIESEHVMEVGAWNRQVNL